MANQALLKRINRARILNAIRVQSPVSRSRVADLLHLDRKSVTNLVSELLAEHLVFESGKKQTGKGRPLTLLELRRDTNWVIGLALSPTSAEGVLVDLYGNAIARSYHGFDFDAPLEAVLSSLQAAFGELSERAGSRLLEVGLAVPGILDTESGRVRRSVNLSCLDGTAFSALLPPDVCSTRISVEESSRAKALAEKWFGLGRTVPSFVCIDLGIGIGAGIVQDRRLYAGQTGYVGEIGHVIIEHDGALCRCGHRGCLEAYVSERAVLERIGGAEQRALTSFADIDSLNSGGTQVMREAGYRLGLGLSYLVNIICPPLIVLSGPLTRFESDLLPELERGLDEGALPACRERVEIRSSSFSNAGAVGAAANALSDLFEVRGHVYV
jgi:predicted NBD/HSP70 family sugar kinase